MNSYEMLQYYNIGKAGVAVIDLENINGGYIRLDAGADLLHPQSVDLTGGDEDFDCKI